MREHNQRILVLRLLQVSSKANRRNAHIVPALRLTDAVRSAADRPPTSENNSSPPVDERVGALLLLAAYGQQGDIVAGAAVKKKMKYTADDKDLYELSIKLLDLVYAGREAVRPEVEPTAADIDMARTTTTLMTH